MSRYTADGSATRPHRGEDAGHGRLYLLWVGAYGNTHVLTRQGSFDDALEALQDWCAEHEPGHFTLVTRSDIVAAGIDDGVLDGSDGSDPSAQLDALLADACDGISEKAWDIVQSAEVDLTTVSHTTYPGLHDQPDVWSVGLPSWEWGGSEVDSAYLESYYSAAEPTRRAAHKRLARGGLRRVRRGLSVRSAGRRA